MNLLQVSRFLTPLDESIDIHGLQKRFKEMKGLDAVPVEQAVRDYRSTLQGRKKELLKPFGLDDLDKFKDDPGAFVEAVLSAKEAFAAEMEERALYKKVYENDMCLITMPKGPEGAAAAGSLYKRGGAAVCPWCVSTKYPDNMKWWRRYDTGVVLFFYAKKNGSPCNAWCMVMTPGDCLECIDGKMAYSQMEGVRNPGKPNNRKRVYKNMCAQTGLTDSAIVAALKPVLLPNKAHFETQNAHSALCRALSTGNNTLAKTLLQRYDIDINDLSSTGIAPLCLAAENDDPSIVRMLLDAGADPSIQNSANGRTPLISAIYANRPENFNILLKAGAEVDGNPECEKPPIYYAALFKRREMLLALIEAGADIRNEAGAEALFGAIDNMDKEALHLLLDMGVNVNACNNKGTTPILHAAITQNWKAVELFLNAGADVNVRAPISEATPLMMCAYFGNVKLCKRLLSLGADTEMQDETGLDAKMYAKMGKHNAVCELFGV